jgi:hypothetical protein
VVCRRTIQVQSALLMSPTLQPETSPIRAAVHTAKSTTSPQPTYLSDERSTRAFACFTNVAQSGSANDLGSSSSSSARKYSRCQPGFRSMMPSRTACSMMRTSTPIVFLIVDWLESSAIQPPVVSRYGLCTPRRFGCFG